MTIKYLPQQHEIRAIEMKHTPEGHYIKTTAATIEVIRAQDEAHKKGWIKEALRRYELYISTYSGRPVEIMAEEKQDHVDEAAPVCGSSPLQSRRGM